MTKEIQTTNDPVATFLQERQKRISAYKNDIELKKSADDFNQIATLNQYTYNFDWLGRPVIQYPQDLQAMQEIIWQVQPDLIIETGIAHGGSLIFSASMLALLDLCDCSNNFTKNNQRNRRQVLGIDIDIREHNKKAIEEHPLSSTIHMIQGSSINKDIVKKVEKFAANYSRIMVFLDSNHTHDHVLAELNLYSPLVSQGSYCVVFDTIVEALPDHFYQDRPWAQGNNPKTAVDAFLAKNDQFEVDNVIDHKLLLSVAPRGYLRRIR